MKRLRALIPALMTVIALASCGADPQTPIPAPETPASPDRASSNPALATLAGEWRVAGIDGADLNESYGLALSADGKEIWWEPRCAGFVRGYTITDGRVRFGPSPSQRRGPVATVPPPPVCAIGPPARLSDVFRALDNAQAIVRTPANGIEISGGGHSVLLFSQ
ncbi:MAG: hypothetical protein WCY11_18205 [Novosphingobium sp.]